MGFEVLHGIVDCLWVIGEPISKFKEAVERETGILTEVNTYDWITFLPMSDGTGAYNRYTGIYITLLYGACPHHFIFSDIGPRQTHDRLKASILL